MRIVLRGNVVDDDSAGIYRLFGFGVCCPADVRAAIERCQPEEELTLEVNSTGGSVYAGFEIYSLLRAYAGKTTAEIQSIAASAMSVVTAACDTVLMSPVAEIMIHRAAIQADGNSRDLKQAAQMLDTIDESILSAYLEKCGGKSDRQTLFRMMRNETFLTAQDAVACGLADAVLPAPDKNNITGTDTDSGGGPANFPAAAVAAMNGVFIYDAPLPPVSDLIRRIQERENINARNNSEEKEPEPMKQNDGETTIRMQQTAPTPSDTAQPPQIPQTPEQLAQMYPELVRQIMDAASASAAAAERKRIADIDALSLPGFESIVETAKADPDANAGTVAQEMIRAQRKSGADYLNARDRDIVSGHVNDVPAADNPDGRTSGQDTADTIAGAAAEAVALWKQYKQKGGEF